MRAPPTIYRLSHMSLGVDSHSGQFTDWPALIGESVLMRQRVNQLDPEVNPYTVPHVGAAVAALDAAEQAAGLRLDPVHRQLLTFANGWEHFFTFTHLLAAEEIGTGPRWQKASEQLDIVYADGPPMDDLPAREDVLVICANPDEVEDIFAIWRTGPLTDGGRPVSWIAGEEVQRFANVHDFLASVNAYLAVRLDKLRS